MRFCWTPKSYQSALHFRSSPLLPPLSKNHQVLPKLCNSSSLPSTFAPCNSFSLNKPNSYLNVTWIISLACLKFPAKLELKSKFLSMILRHYLASICVSNFISAYGQIPAILTFLLDLKHSNTINYKSRCFLLGDICAKISLAPHVQIIASYRFFTQFMDHLHMKKKRYHFLPHFIHKSSLYKFILSIIFVLFSVIPYRM